MIRHSIIFSALLFSISLIFFETLVFARQVPLGNGKIPEIGFYIILVTSAIYFYKKKQQGTIFTHQALSIGYLTTLLAALFSSIYLWFALNYWDNALVAKHKAILVNILKVKEKDHIKTFGLESFQQTMIQISGTTINDIVIDDFLKKIVIMVIPIFLISLILRKK